MHEGVRWHTLFLWVATTISIASFCYEDGHGVFSFGCNSKPTRELSVDNLLTVPTPCYKIPSNSKLSGHGKIWEYYHFLIDFAAPTVELLQNEPCERHRKVVLPGWLQNDTLNTFSLQNIIDPRRNMKPSANFLFQPLNATFMNWENSDQYNELPCQTLNFHPGEWSRGEAVTYDSFRNYAHDLVLQHAHSVISKPHFKYDILLIRRASISNLTCSGSCRRHLDSSFFKDFALFMKGQILLLPTASWKQTTCAFQSKYAYFQVPKWLSVCMVADSVTGYLLSKQQLWLNLEEGSAVAMKYWQTNWGSNIITVLILHLRCA